MTAILPHEPGQLALLGAALGEAGVNIEGMCAMTGDEHGYVHVLVEDGPKAHAALEAAGLGGAEEREVLVVEVANEPGSLGLASWHGGSQR